MANLLFSSNIVDESHAKLEQFIKKFPFAECRVNIESKKPFEVWDSPDDRIIEPAKEIPKLAIDTNPLLVDEIVKRVIEILDARK